MGEEHSRQEGQGHHVPSKTLDSPLQIQFPIPRQCVQAYQVTQPSCDVTFQQVETLQGHHLLPHVEHTLPSVLAKVVSTLLPHKTKIPCVLSHFVLFREDYWHDKSQIAPCKRHSILIVYVLRNPFVLIWDSSCPGEHQRSRGPEVRMWLHRGRPGRWCC